MTTLASELAPSAPPSFINRRSELLDAIGEQRGLDTVVRRGLLIAVAGASIFGVALGCYAGTWAQIASSALKLPLLLLGTALLCFPCFHLLQAWYAPRPLELRQSLALQTTALSTVALVWGHLAPPLLFLVVSTQHYHLAQVMALAVGAAGGVAGLGALLRGYRRLCTEDSRHSNLFLVFYFVLFATVGAQLAWMLRPFIGSPSLAFQLLRPVDPADGNFFSFVLRLLGG